MKSCLGKNLGDPNQHLLKLRTKVDKTSIYFDIHPIQQ